MRARLAIGALAIGVVLLSVSHAGSASPVWTVTSGSATSLAHLSAVSCVSARSCQAVGTIGTNSATSKTFAQSWDGTKWSVVRSSGPKASWLFGVSCVAADWCQGVGWSDNSDHVLIEHWDGRTWSKTPNPEHPTSIKQLASVSCRSRQWCVAAGFEFSQDLGYSQPLIESWNGTEWSIVPSPLRGTVDSRLVGISCVSRQSCMAVGSYFFGSFPGSTRTLVERWNGKVWSIVPSPNPNPNNDQALLNVSCVSATWCIAVGRSVSGPLVESWNGHLWTIVPNPVHVRGSELEGVSCIATTSCQAVGIDSNVGNLVERWDGRVWSTLPSPNPHKGFNNLVNISCVSTLSCKAVGNSSFTFSYG